MSKKCIICDAPATLQIKDTSDYYCPSCAQENFSDLSLLVNIEQHAQHLKSLIDEAIDNATTDESADDNPPDDELQKP